MSTIPNPKVEPIRGRGGDGERGMPCDLDAEKLILGCILLDDERYFTAAAGLLVEDFASPVNGLIFGTMRDLRSDNERVDSVTLGSELRRRGMIDNAGGLGYIIDLSNGLPLLPHIESYIRIVQEKSRLRQVAEYGKKLTEEALLEMSPAAELLQRHMAQASALAQRASKSPIQSIENLVSVFANDVPVTWVIEPELPASACVTLAGESESGKSTLAFAWARDAHARGHAVLVLDRDGNPRERIRDRLRRLGVNSDGPRFRIWDYQQAIEAPQPDSPIVLQWVKQQLQETGLAPLVTVDSLISFLGPDGNENDNVQMRAVFHRCEAITRLGGTVVLLHHTGKSETSRDGRGASDYRPASDQGFTVRNSNPDGTRLLHTITLKPTKSRWALTEDIVYHYNHGKMVRAQGANAAAKAASVRLTALLRKHPGKGKDEFTALAVADGLRQREARDFLDTGVDWGEIKYLPNQGRKGGRYYLASDAPEDTQEQVAL